MAPANAAFFDVDGTLTADSTIFRFLRYYLRARGEPSDAYDRCRAELRAMAVAGTPRARINESYFAIYRDAGSDFVAGLAQEWFAAELRHGGMFNAHTVAALRRHQAAGDSTVLVSGSFAACLNPIADHLRIDVVVASVPEVVAGRHTGKLSGPPMIGAAKAEAVRTVSKRVGVSPRACAGYGDHHSDVPMLLTVGQATVTGGDAALRALARTRGWHLLPEARLPSPLPAVLVG